MQKRGNSRGVSTIIVTVLIVLLTLLAVGIVWNVVKNIIYRQSEQVFLGKLTLELEIEKVQILDENNLTITIRRKAGKGDFIAIVFIIEDAENTEKFTENVTLLELEEKMFTLTLNNINTSNIQKIKIAPVFKLNSGKESVGYVKDTWEKSVRIEDNLEMPEEEFVFSYWPMNLLSSTDPRYEERMQAIDDMNASGMNYASVTFRPTGQVEQALSELRNKNYNLALEISAGHYTWGSELPELLDKTADNGNQFFNTSCLNRTICERWDRYPSPAYTGVLWQNTLENTRNVTIRTQPELVMFDNELWFKPQNLEYYFASGGDPNNDCKCYVVRDGIGYEAYNFSWYQRGLELKQTVEEVSPNTTITLFYSESHSQRWRQNDKGGYFSGITTYILNGTGTYTNPSMYLLPNLELLEIAINSEQGSLVNAIPWMSFDYYYGFSNYGAGQLLFDKSVAREAGRMLRKAGAKGFIIYVNALQLEERAEGSPSGYAYNHWLESAQEMIAGFKEGLTYMETNKIKNPDFEALKTKANFYNYSEEIKISGDIRFIPVFWSWEDTTAHNDSSYYANLSFDKYSGMRSWKHLRYGDVGNRTVLSQNFTINPNEEGNYAFSIYTKSNINSENGKINFFLLNLDTETEQFFGEVDFVNSWNKYTNTLVNISSGEYKLEIMISDSTMQQVEVYLDNIILEKN